MKADSKGNMWFGAYGAGLAKMNKKEELMLYSKLDTLKARDINDIEEDVFGNIWIATEGNGFFRYANDTFAHVGAEEHLLSAFIKGIQDDKQGRIWYSYRKGVGYYDIKSGKKRHFVAQDGLRPDEAYSSYIMVDSKHRVWFCNDFGVTLYENDLFNRTKG